MRVENEAARLSMIGQMVSVSDFDVPTMGQLTKINGKHVIISGGKPKPDWSGLMSPQPHRYHPSTKRIIQRFEQRLQVQMRTFEH